MANLNVNYLAEHLNNLFNSCDPYNVVQDEDLIFNRKISYLILKKYIESVIIDSVNNGEIPENFHITSGIDFVQTWVLNNLKYDIKFIIDFIVNKVEINNYKNEKYLESFISDELVGLNRHVLQYHDIFVKFLTNVIKNNKSDINEIGTNVEQFLNDVNVKVFDFYENLINKI